MQRSKPSSTRGLALAALVSVAAALSCTAVVSTDATQCKEDADCAARGPDFAGTVCSAAGMCEVAAAPAGECTKSSDCAAKGAGFVCSSRIQSCVAVESEDCRVVYGDPTADDAVLFGLLSEIGKADSLYFRQGQHARGAQLAFHEFFETSGVKLPGNRSAALVACSERLPRRASAHLANLGVTAVIGPAEEGRHRAVVETLAQASIPTFSPWVNGNPSAVLPESAGLAWITSFLRPEVVAPLNALVAEQEAKLKAQFGLSSVRIAVLVSGADDAGVGAVSPYSEFTSLMDQRLLFNGKTAIENEKDAGCNHCYKRFSTQQSTVEGVAAQVQALVDFAPSIVIPFTDIEWGGQLLPALEKAYAAKPADVERPVYIQPFIQNEEQGYRALPFTDAAVRQRITGIRQVRDNGFELFQNKFEDRFRPPSNVSKLGPEPNRGAGGAFETALLLLFASYAAMTENVHLQPRDLVNALGRVADNAAPTTVTLNDIPTGIQRLNAKQNIHVAGLFTSFDFDYATSAARPRWTSWCLSAAGQLVSNRPYVNGAFAAGSGCP
jgi:hypothetical protein